MKQETKDLLGCLLGALSLGVVWLVVWLSSTLLVLYLGAKVVRMAWGVG